MLPWFVCWSGPWDEHATVSSPYSCLSSSPGSSPSSPPSTCGCGWRWSPWYPVLHSPSSSSLWEECSTIKWWTGSKEHISRTRLVMLCTKTPGRCPAGRRPTVLQPDSATSLKQWHPYQTLLWWRETSTCNNCLKSQLYQSMIYNLMMMLHVPSISI